MAEYQLPEEKRPSVEEWIERYLNAEGVKHLEVCRKKTSGHSKIPDTEIDADELQELGTGEAVLDRVLDLISGMWGRFELRIRFQGYNKDGGKSDVTKAFQMRRVRQPSTKSQGTNAATEQLATSLAGAFDQQAARAQSRDERYTEFLSQMMLRQDESSDRRLAEHSSYQIEIMRLQQELARKDLEIALVEAQQGIPPEMWTEILKVAAPVAGQLIGSISGAIHSWGQSLSPAQLAAQQTAPSLQASETTQPPPATSDQPQQGHSGTQ